MGISITTQVGTDVFGTDPQDIGSLGIGCQRGERCAPSAETNQYEQPES